MFHAQFPGLRAYKSALCSNGCTIQIPPDSCAAIRAAFTFHYGSTYTAVGYKFGIYCNNLQFSFTFHYGSTYTYEKQFIAPLEELVFTFHYVSTYTQIIYTVAELERNLHSTMVLIIQ